MTKERFLFCCAWVCLAANAVLAQTPAVKDAGGLRDAVVLVIRHAEKPETGMELTPAGVERANAYTNYFRKFMIDGKPLAPDCLIATADSKNSHRPRLTLEPLGKALGLPVEARFKAAEVGPLADELRARPHGREILVCWHHGDIPALVEALGADPARLLPGGKWPDQVFSWVLELRYDHEGHLLAGATKRISEDLMLGDAALAEATANKEAKAAKKEK